MGRRKKESEKDSFNQDWVKALKKETLEGIMAVIFLIISIFLILAPFNKAGIVGNETYKIFSLLFGIGYYILPLVLIILGVSFIKSLSHNLAWPKIIGAFIFTLSGIGLINLFFKKGGIIGNWISTPLVSLFDYWVSAILLIGLIIISILVMFETSINFAFIKKIFEKKEKDNSKNADELLETEIKLDKNSITETAEIQKDSGEEKNKKTEPNKNTETEINQKQTGLIFLSKKSDFLSPYKAPPISLFENDSGKPGVGDIKSNANIIKRTLANFGIQVEMDEISVGPSVTRYALKPAEGVKLSRIVALQNDLSLALAAHPLRVEAPIPGKSLVGIEIPNSSKTRVGLGTLFKQPEFENSSKQLLMTLGKGVTGQSFYADLSKMPHLLIAGTTGSGKSVTIHTIISSLLFRNSPEMLKFIMVDPKRVELTMYNKIPHLLTPVITDPKKTILALKWAANEMSRRYDILESNGVRDIASYHKNILEPALEKAKKGNENLPETMPFIVIIIDELADIMQTYPRELEAGVVRLAQMSRAVGIHLIISTQRPSVNVITGLIKANIPGRIALQVASQIDSRTILDMPGAEKLLGAGDMLFLSGEMSQPRRIQSAFISEEEIKKVVEFLCQSHQDDLPENINLDNQNQKVDIFEAVKSAEMNKDNLDEDLEEDDLYEEAKEVVVSAGKASTSYLQRKLRIGYSRAARLMDILEEKGVIGSADGAKPREILVGGENQDSNE